MKSALMKSDTLNHNCRLKIMNFERLQLKQQAGRLKLNMKIIFFIYQISSLVLMCNGLSNDVIV